VLLGAWVLAQTAGKHCRPVPNAADGCQDPPPQIYDWLALDSTPRFSWQCMGHMDFGFQWDFSAW